MASGMFIADGVGEGNLTFRNIVFSGDGASATSIGIYFCAAESMSGLDVQDCKFVNWVAGTSKAIYSRPNSNDEAYFEYIINNDFFNCDYGIFLDGDPDSSINWSLISGNEFDQCDYSIACDYTNFTIITNNIIYGNEYLAITGDSSYFSTNADRNIIMGNDITSTNAKASENGLLIKSTINSFVKFFIRR